ncbi:hypothetical protein AMATHDRAFT_84058 [Amanita thiersii Skay4041]|uniref:Sodium/calcium exchanger membrane region domain-containing protein n=1 Tax=Amanita thiersii Skay4041 TaxID=703135 RepID=A0A2A9NXE0_9AGAR|nr:hypothetical protein AMATHDRAFT_84058 [Amanita thiersii Skay4041]
MSCFASVTVPPLFSTSGELVMSFSDRYRPIGTPSHYDPPSPTSLEDRDIFEHETETTVGIPFSGRHSSRSDATSLSDSMTVVSFGDVGSDKKSLGGSVSTVESLKAIAQASYLNFLFVFVPISWALYLASKPPNIPPALVLSTLCLAMVPIARLSSFATRDLCANIGRELAGFINALTGNLIQLTIAIIALIRCDLHLIESMAVGTILVNLLLIFGLFILEGAINNHQTIEQEFGTKPCDINTSLLVLSVQGMLIPTAFAFLTEGASPSDTVLRFSRVIAITFLVVFFGNLLFQLHRMKVDRRINAQEAQVASSTNAQPKMNRYIGFSLLLTCALLLVFTAKFLVELLDEVTQGTESAPKLFTIIVSPSLKTSFGRVVIPLISFLARCFDYFRHRVQARNAPSGLVFEISTTFGSSIQMTLFVMPLLVVIGWIMNKPMTMVLDPFEAFSLFLTVLLVNSVVQDNKCNWLEGMMLLCLYVIFGAFFWLSPEQGISEFMNSCS